VHNAYYTTYLAAVIWVLQLFKKELHTAS